MSNDSCAAKYLIISQYVFRFMNIAIHWSPIYDLQIIVIVVVNISR
jgi:hypothetical protein